MALHFEDSITPILLQSCYLNRHITSSSAKKPHKKWIRSESSSSSLSLSSRPGWKSAVTVFSFGPFSCQEQPGCNQIGSWWSQAATGWSWVPRWPCTSSRSCCTGWGSWCSLAASSSHCRERIKDGERKWDELLDTGGCKVALFVKQTSGNLVFSLLKNSYHC